MDSYLLESFNLFIVCFTALLFCLFYVQHFIQLWCFKMCYSNKFDLMIYFILFECKEVAAPG